MAGEIAAAGINAGASTLQALAQAIFGSKDDKRIKRFLDFLRSQIGTDVISNERQNELFRNADASLAPSRNRFNVSVSKRLGLDSGVAQQEIFQFADAQRSRQRFEIGTLNERLRAARDRSFSSNITSGELEIFNA